MTRKTYALLALMVFALEVVIGLFVRDAFVRPYLGDTLAVILVYLVLRATGWVGKRPAIILALALATIIELAQLFRLLPALGLKGNKFAEIILGSHFEWLDLLAYAVGGLCVILAELWADRKRN